MKLRWKLLIVAVVIIGAALLVRSSVNNQAKSALEEYRKQLRAQGEKLTIAEIAPTVTADEQAAAAKLMDAIRPLGYRITDYPPAMRFVAPGHAIYPPAMRFVAPGHAMVGWREEVLPTADSTDVWPDVIRQVTAHRQDLANVRAALENSDIRFNLNYNQGFLLLLPHLAPLKSTAIWLSAATLAELHEGHPTNALEDLESCIALTRPLELEPIELSQLVRIAIGQIAMNGTWELLQYPNWQDEDLDGLQNEWASLNFLDGIGPSMEMERDTAPIIYDVGRSSISNLDNLYGSSAAGGAPTMDDLAQILENPKDSYEAFMKRYPRYWAWRQHWSYVEELYHLQSQEVTLDCARSLWSGGAFVPARKKLEADLTAIGNSYTNVVEHFYLGMDGGFGSSYVSKIADMEMERRVVVTAIALKRFQLRNGKYPAELKELVPDFLPSLPIDFMDGKPLRYRPNNDGTFLLYSVGQDGEENGGDPALTQASGTTYPSWWKARDAVWPMPATPEETKAYKEKMVA